MGSNGVMTQEEKWMERFNDVRSFIETNMRNPSKHRIEEHDMLNWIKYNRKAMNKGEMKLERVQMFNELLAKMEEYKRVNQWK